MGNIDLRVLSLLSALAEELWSERNEQALKATAVLLQMGNAGTSLEVPSFPCFRINYICLPERPELFPHV